MKLKMMADLLKQRTYENAVQALNNLQSNSSYIKSKKPALSHNKEHSNTIEQVEKYLVRSGIGIEDLNKLSVIHVAGTKGKGSTCALSESILHSNGFKTGFFSSPHLVEVRERIRIDGRPLNKDIFAKYFWPIYDSLSLKRDDPKDMPLYFRFLTILAFHVFLTEKVDVAIIEVGIGGQYDCTNVLRKVPVVGITSLGIDHTSFLGDTIEKIAWHKAGIMKEGCRAFTVAQPEMAMKVLKDRAKEINCSLEIIENIPNALSSYKDVSAEIMNLNASLAIALSNCWMATCGKLQLSNGLSRKLDLSKCFWPGRYQVLKKDRITYYLDGAHTIESITLCASWFEKQTSGGTKVLIFNATGDRDSEILLKQLYQTNFKRVFFVPNQAVLNYSGDNTNHNITEQGQLRRCHHHLEIWNHFDDNNKPQKGIALVLSCIADIFNYLDKNEDYSILVTGSLHLVGSVLSIIDPNLEG